MRERFRQAVSRALSETVKRKINTYIREIIAFNRGKHVLRVLTDALVILVIVSLSISSKFCPQCRWLMAQYWSPKPVVVWVLGKDRTLSGSLSYQS